MAYWLELLMKSWKSWLGCLEHYPKRQQLLINGSPCAHKPTRPVLAKLSLPSSNRSSHDRVYIPHRPHQIRLSLLLIGKRRKKREARGQACPRLSELRPCVQHNGAIKLEIDVFHLKAADNVAQPGVFLQQAIQVVGQLSVFLFDLQWRQRCSTTPRKNKQTKRMLDPLYGLLANLNSQRWFSEWANFLVRAFT